MVKAVCFDFGGVLVQIARTWEEACTRAGLNPELAGRSGADMIRAVGPAADLQTGAIDFDEFIERSHQDGTSTPDRIQLRDIHAGWLIEEFSGMKQIIEQLNRLGIQTASLSNTDAEHWKTLCTMESISTLKTQILSFETGLRKPAPATYHAAEDLLDIPGSSILLLDDLQENVEAALHCGWQASLIDPNESVSDQARIALLTQGIDLTAE